MENQNKNSTVEEYRICEGSWSDWQSGEWERIYGGQNVCYKSGEGDDDKIGEPM